MEPLKGLVFYEKKITKCTFLKCFSPIKCYIIQTNNLNWYFKSNHSIVRSNFCWNTAVRITSMKAPRSTTKTSWRYKCSLKDLSTRLFNIMYFMYYSFVFLCGSIWCTHKFATDYICRFKSNLVHTLKINMPMLIQKRNKKHNM